MTPGQKRARSRRRRKLVSEVMRRDFVTVRVDESLSEAVGIMRMARLRHLVVERSGQLVGILSYRDLQDLEIERLKRHAEAGPVAPPHPLVLEEAMLDSPYVVAPDAPLHVAASRMSALGLGCLPVVDSDEQGGRLVGLVTESDLLRAAFPVS